jgi:hypothetical protein
MGEHGSTQISTMKKLPWNEFRLLKDRLYRSKNALELALESCPELNLVETLSDGRKIDGGDVLAYLAMLRSECWKHGPAEVQERKVKEIVQQQPRG